MVSNGGLFVYAQVTSLIYLFFLFFYFWLWHTSTSNLFFL